MKLLLIGDVHLADRPPSVRTETYADDILDKVRWCSEYAEERALAGVVYLGDVFHVKSPSRTSHELVQRTAAAMQRFSGQTWIVPGNHDLSADRLDSLESQPLGTLALAERIHLADGFIDGPDFYAIPYLDDLQEFVRLCAVAQDYAPRLIVTHQSIFPADQDPPYAHIKADAVAYALGATPLAYGHIHDPHGFYRARDAWLCNNGAISRGSLHEETLKRKPKVTVFDSEAEGCPFTSVDVPHRPAAEVFRLDEVQEKKDAEAKLDDFLAKVGEVSLTSLSLEAVLNDARSKLSPVAMTELLAIIEGIG